MPSTGPGGCVGVHDRVGLPGTSPRKIFPEKTLERATPGYTPTNSNLSVKTTTGGRRHGWGICAAMRCKLMIS